MAVYVDDMLMKATVGNITSRWSHLIADTDEELHRFARKLGLRREWAQYPGTAKSHYDLTERKRLLAIERGATPITWLEAGRQFNEKLEAERAQKKAAAEAMLPLDDPAGADRGRCEGADV